MQKRKLGKTGLLISELGFGGIPLQKVEQQDADEIFLALKESGIQFVDTAKAYGKSEALIGEAIKKLGREHFILATKAPETTYQGMKASIENSLKQLQTDCIDLYQIHNVRTKEKLEEVYSEEGALKALLEAKKEGKILHIGITSHSVDLLLEAIEKEEFETIQYPYNFIERQGEELFQKAKEKNIGVICMKPMAGGAIDKKDLSLKFILQNENVTVAIPGMESVKEVKENVEAVSSFSLTEEEWLWIQKEREELGGQFCRRCGYCGPCPQGIDIPSQFVFMGYHKRYGLQGWATERYFAQSIKADACVECGLCEPKCPYDLPIRKMLKEVTETFSTCK